MAASPDFFLPNDVSVLFVDFQTPQSQFREAESAQRFARNAVRSTPRFSFQNPVRVYRASELGEQLAKNNPTVLNLRLPGPAVKPRAKYVQVNPAIINPDELGKIIPAAARDLIILTVDNAHEWELSRDSLQYWAPVVVWTTGPVSDRMWGDFQEVWYKVLGTGIPIRAAFEKAIEGIGSDFPEAGELLILTINEEFASERALREPQVESFQEEPNLTEEAPVEFEQERMDLPESQVATPESQLTNISGGAHSDHPADQEEKDWLGYKSYAQIIAQIIKDPESEPPLSIAIIGPWGQGKSSLMRMIQRRVSTRKPVDSGGESGKRPSPWQLQAWTNRNNKEKKDTHWTRLVNPTVWFNPWEYQSSEQIWSGMAHAIIHQLVGQLPRIKQEKFWLELHLERVDRQAIRQRLFRDVLTRALPWMLLTLMVVVVGTILIATNKVTWALEATGVLSLSGLAATAFSWVKNWREGLENVYDEFLKPPDYSKSLGMYHDVNNDLERVFDLLVDKPAVIFIDDLDRCSPKKVVEVVEAINLIMNARFRQKCYFVIGMDAEMVAAALDVAYGGMKGKFPGKEKNLGSVGWYFLDKFIQVPVVLPTMSEDDKARFLEKLFGEKDHAIQPRTRSIPQATEEVKKVARDLLDSIKRGDTSIVDETREQSRSVIEQDELDEAVLELAYEETEDAEDIHAQVREFATYLDPSPRSIKRFANLLRFYTSQQQLRETKSTTSHPIDFADTAALAKWLIITLRWPMMVRWLQWREDLGLYQPDPIGEPMLVLSSNIPEDKARELDLLVFPGMGDAYYESIAKVNPHLPWLADKDLIRILTEKNRPEDELLRAFQCDVW